MIVSYINNKIQIELEKRRKALARESNSPLNSNHSTGTKKFNEYLSRTPYVVMASNLNPAKFNVAIGGGEMYNDSVYKDAPGKPENKLLNYWMHGLKRDGSGAYKKTHSKGLSPISGIKDILVEYKGGYKGIREATVNWSVNSIEALNFYTPHFLAIGRSVALEWGWTMFKTLNTQKFITYTSSEIRINGNLFTNPSEIIIDGNGNLDGIGGVVTNFNFKLRDDGGFDCTTTLSALGVNFFGGGGLDSSGEGGSGLILSGRENTITFQTSTNDAANEKEKMKIAAINLMETKNKKNKFNRINIIEELINLPPKLLRRMAGNLGKKFPIKDSTESYLITESKKTRLNYFRWVSTLRSDKEARQGGYMIRWGWLEDNVFSKYTSAVNKSREFFFKFRSIDKNGESVKIGYDENLIPINPLSSMIYADSTAYRNDIIYIDDLEESSAETNAKMIEFFKLIYSDIFNHETPDRASNERLSKFNKTGYGKMRNIYVSLTDVLESFGVDKELAATITNTVGNEAINPSWASHGNFGVGKYKSNAGYYYVDSNKIKPPKSIEAAINILLKKISRNFHNYWKFRIVSDTETMGNIRVIDENYVAPDTSRGSSQEIKYTLFDTNGGIDTSGGVSLGIYKFPSFTAGSIVKSQTLEFKLPDAMKTVAMYGSNAPDGSKSADPNIRKFHMLGALNKSPQIISDGTESHSHILSDLRKLQSFKGGHKFGNEDAGENVPLTITGAAKLNSYKTDNFYVKYVKINESVDKIPKQAKENLGPGENYTNKYKFYVLGETGFTLRTEAVRWIRNELGITDSDGGGKSYLIPADLGLEIDGIGGIKPGDICHTDYIQHIYNQEWTNGPSTFFQIFGIAQKVSVDGWVTSLETKMRLNGNVVVPNKFEYIVGEKYISEVEKVAADLNAKVVDTHKTQEILGGKSLTPTNDPIPIPILTKEELDKAFEITPNPGAIFPRDLRMAVNKEEFCEQNPELCDQFEKIQGMGQYTEKYVYKYDNDPTVTAAVAYNNWRRIYIELGNELRGKAAALAHFNGPDKIQWTGTKNQKEILYNALEMFDLEEDFSSAEQNYSDDELREAWDNLFNYYEKDGYAYGVQKEILDTAVTTINGYMDDAIETQQVILKREAGKLEKEREEFAGKIVEQIYQALHINGTKEDDFNEAVKKMDKFKDIIGGKNKSLERLGERNPFSIRVSKWEEKQLHDYVGVPAWYVIQAWNKNYYSTKWGRKLVTRVRKTKTLKKLITGDFSGGAKDKALAWFEDPLPWKSGKYLPGFVGPDDIEGTEVS